MILFQFICFFDSLDQSPLKSLFQNMDVKKPEFTFEDDEDSSKYENDSGTDQSDVGDLPGDDDNGDDTFISQIQWPQSFR